MKRLAGFRKKVIEGWTVQRIAAVLIVAGLAVFVAGVVNKHCACAGWPNFGDTLNDVISDFYANVSVDCLSIAFAILVIDRLNERREEEQEDAQLKAQLIREMRSSDNGIALHAVEELRARGWLEDGSLQDAFFSNASLRGAVLINTNLQGVSLRYANLQWAFLINANLQGASLEYANLQGANLTNANLQGASLEGTNLQEARLLETNFQEARLRDANLLRISMPKANLLRAELSDKQLVAASSLLAVTMSDGSLYDGRFNLTGDITIASLIGVDTDNSEAMACWYGVSLEEYLAGQEWARENLAALRREAGLDPDTGLPVEPTNGVEPQPADAPAAPAPRRNGHKASMVAHRVRR